MDKFRAENLHCIGGKQVKKVVKFWATGIRAAQRKFRRMRLNDNTIHEAALYRIRDGWICVQYIGYC